MNVAPSSGGGRFDFDDGGTYRGGWQDGKAHGYGVCTGPSGRGEYAGVWNCGFEESGTYLWPSGNTYAGQWRDGKRHNLGVETKGHWVYRGEWTLGTKGRYGVKHSTISGAKYEGTWTTGLQDGYGVETYADDGTYQGQWLRGVRHGYGVRVSAAFLVAAKYRGGGKDGATSLPSDDEDGTRKLDRSRGGFVLRGRSAPTSKADGRQSPNIPDVPRSRSSSLSRIADRFRLTKKPASNTKTGSTGNIDTLDKNGSLGRITSNGGIAGVVISPAGTLPSAQDADVAAPDTRETYAGEWKGDKRSGFGVSERSDGLRYVGEWYNDKKCGYGVTTFKDGTKEEAKYKDNEVINSTSGSTTKLFSMGKRRVRDRVDAAVQSALRAANVAHEKADIALSRASNAKLRAELADTAAKQADADAATAMIEAKQYDRNPVSNAETVLKSVQQPTSSSEQRPNATAPSSQPDSQLRRLPSRQEAVDADQNIRNNPHSISNSIRNGSSQQQHQRQPQQQLQQQQQPSTTSSSGQDVPLRGRLSSTMHTSASSSSSGDAMDYNTSMSSNQEQHQQPPRGRTTVRATVNEYPSSMTSPYRSSRTADVGVHEVRFHQQAEPPGVDNYRAAPQRLNNSVRQDSSETEDGRYGRSQSRFSGGSGNRDGTQSDRQHVDDWSDYEDNRPSISSYSQPSTPRRGQTVVTENPCYQPPRAQSPQKAFIRGYNDDTGRRSLRESTSDARLRQGGDTQLERKMEFLNSQPTATTMKNMNSRTNNLANSHFQSSSSNYNEPLPQNYGQRDFISNNTVADNKQVLVSNPRERQEHTSSRPYADLSNRNKLPQQGYASNSISSSSSVVSRYNSEGNPRSMLSHNRPGISALVPSPYNSTAKIPELSLGEPLMERRSTLPSIIKYPVALPERTLRTRSPPRTSRSSPSPPPNATNSSLPISSNPAPSPSRPQLPNHVSQSSTLVKTSQLLPTPVSIRSNTLSPLLSPTPIVCRSTTLCETFLVGGGVRKRIVSEHIPSAERSVAVVDDDPMSRDDTLENIRQLPERFRLEANSSFKSSLPDVSRLPSQAVMPREQVAMLSQHRRDELRQMRNELEHQQIVIRFGDIREWCAQNQLILLLIALNLCLAAMFLQLVLERKSTRK